MKKVLTLFLLLALLSPTYLYAASPWTEKDSYGKKVEGKLLFGLKNTFLGWLDLFNEPVKASTENKSPFYGAYRGIVDSLCNTGGGILHVATFFAPFDIPLPDNGVDLSSNLR